MKIFYVSPSNIPSNEANLVHVIQQVAHLSKLNKIYVYLTTSFFSKQQFNNYLLKKFKLIENKNIIFFRFFLPFNKYRAIFIGLFALFSILINARSNDLILSRNIFFSFIASLMNIKHIYEIHNIESSIHGFMQKTILQNKNIISVTISKKLKKYLINKFNIKNKIHVLHDAASVFKFNNFKIKKNIERTSKYIVCCYTGTIDVGRGIELIIDIAKNNRNIIFNIAGSVKNKNLADRLKKINNINFYGYISHHEVSKLIFKSDVLLMPYAKGISIGSNNIDSSRWMSPLKMFEYMASGKPIISSDLPVLREVLKNEYNAYLVKSKNVNDWISVIEKAFKNKKIGINALNDFKKKYTWEIRSKRIVALWKKY